MLKPNWKDAPEWANYLAMDEGGLWCWYEEKPFYENDGRWKTFGKFENINENIDIYWGNSLESRP